MSSDRHPRRLFTFDSKSSGDSSSIYSTPESNEDRPLSPPARSNNFRPASPARRPAGALEPLLSSITVASQDGRSPSLRRWENLRQHVVPRSSTDSLQSSGSAAAASLAPVRANAPKPSRLAKLGLRQVVEHANIASTESSRFAADIQKACFAAKSVDTQKFKVDLGSVAASATFSSFTSGTPLSHTFNSHKKHEPRRPPSIQFGAVASLKSLYQTLLQYAGQAGNNGQLPYETTVLATLLSPFLSSDKGPRIEEERWFAVESFDTIVKTWRHDDESIGIQRCLWCIKAALMPPCPLRSRLITMLWALIVAQDTRYPATTPQSLQALTQALFFILPSIQNQASEDARNLTEVLHRLRLGCGGELDSLAVEEEYNALFTNNDDTQSVRDALLIESLTRCMEGCAIPGRQWLLRNAVENYWPLPPSGLTLSPLLAVIHMKKLATFTSASLSMLLQDPVDLSDAQLIAGIFDTRVIPEIEVINGTNIPEVRISIVKVVLEILSLYDSRELIHWASSLVSHWYRDSPEWKRSFEQAVQDIVTTSQWPKILKLAATLLQGLPDDIRKPVIAFIVPIINDQLVDDPPPYPSSALTAFLSSTSEMYPQVFYKPLFSCAASSKEFTVVNILCTITVISKFLPDFWIRNAEMMSVAIMSYAPPRQDLKGPVWGTARLGQSVIILELVAHIQSVRKAKEASTCPDNIFVDTVKFAVSLEGRLTVLLEAKEKTTLVPPSQRVLFCLLLREMRLLTRSLKSAPWLSRVVSWFVQYHMDDDDDLDFDEEFTDSINQLQAMYSAARAGSRSTKKQRQSIMLLSLNDASGGSGKDLASFASRELVSSLSKGFIARCLKLLVAVSALLSAEHLRQMGPLLWEQYLEFVDSSTLSSGCFLFMQCAEKLPLEIGAVIEMDLQNSNDQTRLRAVRKISILTMSRFQIMSQHVITDRAHRPFKLVRGPLAFVATDIGSSHFTADEADYDQKDGFPAELKKRLAEIGWTDDEAPVDQQQQWILTPFTSLPSHYFERLDVSALDASSPPSPNLSPLSSPQKKYPGETTEEFGLLRRNSSTGGPLFGVKRRSVFVPALAQVFPLIAKLVADPCLAVAALARNTIVELMRNDPNLLTRPVFDLFVGENSDIDAAISAFRALLLHVRHTLPPPLSFHTFNYMTGFVKYLSKHVETEDALHDFARTIPVLSRVATHVSGLGARDLRKAKVEIFMMPSGALWFPPGGPTGPMFPRSLGSDTGFGEIPPRLVSVTMIRISQNMMLLAMLKRNSQEVQVVRKSMTRLVLPSLRDEVEPPVLDLKDFIPQHRTRDPSQANRDTKLMILSLILSHSYVPLVAQIFRSMSRHLNDRNELAIFMDGLNRILLAHGSDIGIVSQALIALMVASTRFKRLFASAGGYTLFMPAVLRVYAESEHHAGIRLAIEYAISRFYAHHRESFVFQTLDIMGHIMILGTNAEWIAKGIYSLFASLRRGLSADSYDAAGIHDANKLQERETLMVTIAEEKPQTFLAAIRGAPAQGKPKVAFNLPEEYQYDNARLAIDNFIRLLLTVIAHDLTITRAEQFMKLLRFLAPELYNASATARTVLGEGIDALGMVLFKMSPKNRLPDAPWSHSSEQDEGPYMAIPALMDSRFLDKSKKPSNLLAIQLDYLSVVLAFARAGGQLTPPSSHRVIELVKLLLRESPTDINRNISSFLTEYSEITLIQHKSQSLKDVLLFLTDLAPLISAYTLSVDFSKVFDAISQLCTYPTYADHPAFSQLVVAQICQPALAACESAAADKLLFTLPSRTSLVSLLAQATMLKGADVIAEIEKRSPTGDFLSGLVLPLVVAMQCSADLRAQGPAFNSTRQAACAQAWSRILAFAMKASESHDAPQTKLRRRSRSGSPAKSNDQLPTLLTALQIIKVIIIRAESDLTSSVPGIWFRLGSFLKRILAAGNSDFVFRSSDISPAHTPSHSPRASAQFDLLSPTMSMEIPSLSLHSRAFISPRVVDYCLWSFFELVCFYRNPLLLQMRLLMQEKLCALDRDLRHQSSTSPSSPRGRRLSSVFSKPRRRSGLPTPEASPRLGPSPPFTPIDSYYQPIVPSQSQSPLQESKGLKIVHLGLVASPSRSSSPQGGGLWLMAKATTLKSLPLIRKTYYRIRSVQFFMGYRDVLLPFPDDKLGEEAPAQTVWSTSQALDNVAEEMQWLTEEFSQFDDPEDDLVLVKRSLSDSSH
ncbi:hypothetical protein C8J56DRAFT_858679 [Mycena floridula]|nr:hypothetical protein C8J56DRAFT_858679 [Mycena floridula]